MLINCFPSINFILLTQFSYPGDQLGLIPINQPHKWALITLKPVAKSHNLTTEIDNNSRPTQLEAGITLAISIAMETVLKLVQRAAQESDNLEERLMCRCDIWNCCILCAIMHQKAWVQTQLSSSPSPPFYLIQKKVIMIASMEVMKITKDICKHSTTGLSRPTFSLQQHPSAGELKWEILQFRLIQFYGWWHVEQKSVQGKEKAGN